MKLNQVIALVSGKKVRAIKLLTDAHHGMKEVLLSGIIRNYEPLDEDGERFPAESKQVQLKLHRLIPQIVEYLVDYYDCVNTQEKANQLAKADIIIDGKCLIKDIPVTVLLFLEKQVTDLLTFARNLPVLSSEKVWGFDENRDCFITEPEKTTKTQKLPKVITKYEATKEHPAQTEIFTIDKTIGHWSTIHLSGAMKESDKQELIKRLEKLQDALKESREKANSQEIEFTKIGDCLMSYIFTNK